MTILSLISMLAMLFAAAPAGCDSVSFYAKRNTEHRQPTLDPMFSYIEEYDAYYVDKAHGDDCDERVLYLTFDAGYENGNIERILDVLKEENVPAAFFVLENLIRRDTALVRRMRDEGHLVCNHTMHHLDMSKITDPGKFQKELEDLEALFLETTGKEMPKFYRPPQGTYSEKNLEMAQNLGYKTVFWSLAYVDWNNDKQPTAEYAFGKLLPRTHNGAVVLLHSTSSTNAAILDELLTKWEQMGYRFAPITELFSEI